MAILPILIGSAYLAVSAFFFYFPKYLHSSPTLSNPILAKTMSQPGKILKISHRGGPRHSTENTMQAFRKVFHISDCLEMDVCETADGVLVVHHDKSLLRSCGVDKLVSQCKYEELPRYQHEIKLDFGVSMVTKTKNQRIPKLEEVFQVFEGVPMDIELKTPTERAINNFVRLIKEHNRQDHTIIGMRSKLQPQLADQYLKLIKQQNKHILTFMSDRSVYKLYVSYVLGLLPFTPIKQSSLQIPIYSKQFEQWCVQRARNNNRSQTVTRLGTQMIRFMNFISKPLIAHLKKRGVMTFGWVCNTEEAMDRARWMGVQGIMSDQPYLLNEWMEKYEKQSKFQ